MTEKFSAYTAEWNWRLPTLQANLSYLEFLHGFKQNFWRDSNITAMLIKKNRNKLARKNGYRISVSLTHKKLVVKNVSWLSVYLQMCSSPKGVIRYILKECSLKKYQKS